MRMNPLTAIDFYKADHRRQYPIGTQVVYSNFTPRASRTANKEVVFFGLQYFIQEFLIDTWNEGFFKQPKEEVVAAYKRRMDTSLGEGAIPIEHIEAIHDLGYLPIRIKALPEGTIVPVRIPVFTIENTNPEFFWLTNYLESVISCMVWKMCTSATTAWQYRKKLNWFAEATGMDKGFVQFQGHDFSFRGMSGLQDAAMSGAAHLLSFVGTDTVCAIDFLEKYYGANAEKELIGCSVPATEHSVMCMGGQLDELETFRRLICDVYPNGIVSIVSDTWDFWQVVTKFTEILKTEIMARNGKVVIRPDSGDPVKIIAGDLSAPVGSPEYKGAVECLWEVFGGTETQTGHKLLDSHIGLIYGDSITLERADAILSTLAAKGFSSGNVVFGIGSYTYNYVTRDNYGFAMKATFGVVNGENRFIFKDPKTDDGTKKSARGKMIVERDGGGKLRLHEGLTHDAGGLLETVFEDGEMKKSHTLSEIRNRLIPTSLATI